MVCGLMFTFHASGRGSIYLHFCDIDGLCTFFLRFLSERVEKEHNIIKTAFLFRTTTDQQGHIWRPRVDGWKTFWTWTCGSCTACLVDWV